MPYLCTRIAAAPSAADQPPRRVPEHLCERAYSDAAATAPPPRQRGRGRSVAASESTHPSVSVNTVRGPKAEVRVSALAA